MDLRDLENILETYDFEELLEENDLTEADVLLVLIKQKLIHLPEVKPVDFHDQPSFK